MRASAAKRKANDDVGDTPHRNACTSSASAEAARISTETAPQPHKPRSPVPPVVLEDLQKAGAAKAEGAPPLSQAQVDRIVAILRQAGSRDSMRRGRGAPHRKGAAVGAILDTGGIVRSRSSSRSCSPSAAAPVRATSGSTALNPTERELPERAHLLCQSG